MKPLHIGILIAVGAVGGAVFMKVIQRQPVAPAAPVAVESPAPPVTPATPPVTAPPAAEAEATPAVEPERRPSPMLPARETRRPKRATASAVPVTVEPPKTVAAAQPPAAPPAPEPVAQASAPQPVPPAQPEPEHVTPPPPPAPPEPRKVTLNAGIVLPVRLVDGLSSERNAPGDTFAATLDKELVVDGFVIAERGARVDGRVVSSDRGGRVSGVATLGVQLTRLRLSDGQTISLSTDSFERHAEPTHRDDATKIGAGAAIGAVIGAIAGGGKGAAIGAGAGGAAGAGTVMATRGKAATLPSETRLSFRLNNPVEITERR